MMDDDNDDSAPRDIGPSLDAFLVAQEEERKKSLNPRRIGGSYDRSKWFYIFFKFDFAFFFSIYKESVIWMKSKKKRFSIYRPPPPPKKKISKRAGGDFLLKSKNIFLLLGFSVG